MVFVTISSLVVVLITSPFTPFIVFAEPMDENWGTGDCKTVKKDGWIYNSCCWKKDGKTYCQTCKTDGKTNSCGPVNPIGFQDQQDGFRPTFPVDKEVSELPLNENSPPIKSDNSVPQNEDSNVIDEQQSNPNSPLTNQRVPSGNVGILEQLEDSSNSESEDSVSSENPGLFNVIPQNPSVSEQP